jgi:hypothetical protein
MDFATPIEEPITKRFIARHRLQKKDPAARVSEAVKPIVYYVDRGAPDPVRSALVEGARWWSQAFEAIGYKDAFRVEIMPADVDPMDARYNVIQWVHRSTRGWSYGNSLVDPRTEEIIQGSADATRRTANWPGLVDTRRRRLQPQMVSQHPRTEKKHNLLAETP